MTTGRARARHVLAATGGRLHRARAAPDRPPTVTVVIPCHNYGHFLPACVASVLGQEGVEVDAIVIDDASTDGSAEVAEELAARDRRITLIRHRVNAGHIQTYNEGLDRATGTYVSLLSSDDLLTPGALARATALMEAHPEVGLVYGPTVQFSGTAPPARLEPWNWSIWSGRDWLARRFEKGRNCIWSPEAVLRTEVQRAIGGYDAGLPHSGDFEMWMRAAGVTDVGYVAGADQAYYRLHECNMHASVFGAAGGSGLLVDLKERRAAFAAASRRTPVRDPIEAMARADRALAIEALVLVMRSYRWGAADAWPIEELQAWALEVYPDAPRRRELRAIDRRERMGRERCPSAATVRVHDRTLRGRESYRRWRVETGGA